MIQAPEVVSDPSKDPFLDARLLVEHAGRHAAAVRQMSEREHGSLGNFRIAPGRPGHCRYQIDVVRVIPPEITLYGADALHNMRSAMDLAVWASASFVEGSKKPWAKLKFPHGEKRELYLKAIEKLNGLLPERAIEFLRAKVDLHREDIPLYPVFAINNSNKHRELIPIAFNIIALALERRGCPQQFVKVPEGLGTKLGTFDLGEIEGSPATGLTSLAGIRFVSGGKISPTGMTHMVEQTRAIVEGLAEACAL